MMKLIRLGICVVLASSIFNAMAMDHNIIKRKRKSIDAPQNKRYMEEHQPLEEAFPQAQLRIMLCLSQKKNYIQQDLQKLSEKDLLGQAATRNRNLSISQRTNLLKQVQDPDILNPQDHYETPLIWAAQDSHTTFLIHSWKQAGHSVDLQNNKGQTALMQAAESNVPNAVRLLLYFGANTTLTNNDEKTAYDLAEENLKHQKSKYFPVDYPQVKKKTVEIIEMLSNFEAYKKNHPEKFEDIEQEREEAETVMNLPASDTLTISKK